MLYDVLHDQHPELSGEYNSTTAERPSRAITNATTGRNEGYNNALQHVHLPRPGTAMSLDVYVGQANDRCKGEMSSWQLSKHTEITV